MTSRSAWWSGRLLSEEKADKDCDQSSKNRLTNERIKNVLFGLLSIQRIHVAIVHKDCRNKETYCYSKRSCDSRYCCGYYSLKKIVNLEYLLLFR